MQNKFSKKSKIIALILMLAVIAFSGCGKALESVTKNQPAPSDVTAFESKTADDLATWADSYVGADATAKTTFTDGTNILTSGATYVGIRSATGTYPTTATTCGKSGCHDAILGTYVKTLHGTAWENKATSKFDVSTKTYCVNCHAVDSPFIDVNSDHTYTAGTDISVFGLTPTDYHSLVNNSADATKASAVVTAAYRGIQCENCHGPGSAHVSGGGDPNKIVKGSVTAATGYEYTGGGPAGNAIICKQCHGQVEEWQKSMHAIAVFYDAAETTNPASHAAQTGTSGTTACGSCHTGEGFITAVSKGYEPKDYGLNIKLASYAYNINCVTCHDPHSKNTQYQLRLSKEDLCGACHNQRYGVGAYLGTSSGAGSSYRLVHQPQREMVKGGTGYTGESGYSSTGSLISVGPAMGSTSCPDCHMYDGSHTFAVQKEACQSCHAGMNAEYVIGIKQKEFDEAWEKLKTRLTTLQDSFEAKIQSDKNDTTYKLDTSPGRCGKALKSGYTEYTEWVKRCAWAEFNMRFMEEEYSKGLHNILYTEKLLTETDKLLTYLETTSMK